MAFDEKELEVAGILLQLPRLISDFRFPSRFSPAWGSKKQRTKMRRFAPTSGRKSAAPSSFPNSKIEITLKRKRPEIHRQNSTRSGGAKGRSCVCAVKDESFKRKKVTQTGNSSGAFLLPDLNLPILA